MAHTEAPLFVSPSPQAGSRELEALKTYIADKAKTQLDLTTA
jgi:hypothetical protein